ncbi:hypothetical protein MBANPS3_001111 [Mucor bainieri]
MIARTSLKTLYNRKAIGKLARLPTCDQQQQKRGSSSSSSYNNDNSKDSKDKKQQMTKPAAQATSRAPDIPSFMPVVNIPVAELAHNAFYSLHRPLLGLSTPRPFLAGDMVGQIKKEEHSNESEEALLQYMMSLRPFEPPGLDDAIKEEQEKCSTTTLTVEVDPSYFLNHNNNHDEIADYLTAMQEKLDLLYDERTRKLANTNVLKKKTRRLRKRKGFFEKN